MKRKKTLAERVRKELKSPRKETTFVKAFIVYSITAFILTFLIGVLFMSIENPSMTGLAAANTTINETNTTYTVDPINETNETINATIDVLSVENIIVSGPLIIYIILMLAFITSISYVIKKYILQIETGSGWLKAVATLIFLSTGATALYNLNYGTPLLISYLSVAFIIAYHIVLEIWAKKSGFNSWLVLKGKADEIAESELLFRKFNEKAAAFLSWAASPARMLKSEVIGIFRAKDFGRDADELSMMLEKLKEAYMEGKPKKTARKSEKIKIGGNLGKDMSDIKNSLKNIRENEGKR